MKTQTVKILNILRIIAWIGYIGTLVLLVLTTLITGYCFLFSDTDFAKKIFVSDAQLSFDTLKNNYLGRLIFYYVLSAIKIYFIIKVWQLAKNALTIINIDKPFTREISHIIEKIAFWMIVIGTMDFIINFFVMTLEMLVKNHHKINFSPDLTYLFGVGIIYFISQIFKRGVEIQAENELTV